MKKYILQLVAAYFVGVSSSILVGAPRKKIFQISIIDVLGWIAYLLCRDYFSFGDILSTYIAGVVIAFSSQVFARLLHEPVTVFFIPGFYTLVPGGGMYKTALAFFQGNTAKGLFEFVNTLFIALAIALAVFTVDNIMMLINKRESFKFIRLGKENGKH